MKTRSQKRKNNELSADDAEKEDYVSLRPIRYKTTHKSILFSLPNLHVLRYFYNLNGAQNPPPKQIALQLNAILGTSYTNEKISHAIDYLFKKDFLIRNIDKIEINREKLDEIERLIIQPNEVSNEDDIKVTTTASIINKEDYDRNGLTGRGLSNNISSFFIINKIPQQKKLDDSLFLEILAHCYNLIIFSKNAIDLKSVVAEKLENDVNKLKAFNELMISKGLYTKKGIQSTMLYIYNYLLQSGYPNLNVFDFINFNESKSNKDYFKFVTNENAAFNPKPLLPLTDASVLTFFANEKPDSSDDDFIKKILS